MLNFSIFKSNEIILIFLVLTFFKSNILKFHKPYPKQHDLTSLRLRLAALQIRAGERSITANPQHLTTHIYHEMITMTGGFFKNFFLLMLFLFTRNSFKRS